MPASSTTREIDTPRPSPTRASSADAAGVARPKHSTGRPVSSPAVVALMPRSALIASRTGETATIGPRRLSASSRIAATTRNGGTTTGTPAAREGRARVTCLHPPRRRAGTHSLVTGPTVMSLPGPSLPGAALPERPGRVRLARRPAPSRPEVPCPPPSSTPSRARPGPVRTAPTATRTCAPTPPSATPAPSRWSPSTGASTGGRSPTSTPAPRSPRSSTRPTEAGWSWPPPSRPARRGATCRARTSWRPRTSPRPGPCASSTRSTPAGRAACRGPSSPAGSRGSRGGCRCASRSPPGPA